jgi:tRNA(adenine34) deaminase
VQTVTTVSTFPPPGTFARPAGEIAEIMAKPEVSPKGLGSAVRMIQYFINRAGRNLSPHRRRELELAKRILQRRSGAARCRDFGRHQREIADRRAT